MPRLLLAIAAALFAASCNEPPTDYRECPPGVDPGSFDCVFPRPERDTGAAADTETADVGTTDDAAGDDVAIGGDASEGSGAQEGSGQIASEPADAPCGPGDSDCPSSN
jgi:hypothetical protein